MVTPLKDMEVAFWNYLTSKAAYTALGLKEFRTYDGNRLPFDRDTGLWPASDLPAISLELESWDKTITGLDTSEDPATSLIGHKLQSTCRGLIVYRGPTRDAFEAGVMVIREILDSRAAHAAGLGNTAAVEDYEVEWGDVAAWSGRNENKGQVLFWSQEFSLIPQTHRAVITT